MHIARILGLCAFGLVLLGCFLPWVSVGGMVSIAGSEGDGWFPVAFLAPVVVMSFLGDWAGGYGKGKSTSVVVLGLIATLFMVWKIIDIGNAGGPLGELLDVDLGLGIYLETAGSALAIIAGIIGARE